MSDRRRSTDSPRLTAAPPQKQGGVSALRERFAGVLTGLADFVKPKPSAAPASRRNKTTHPGGAASRKASDHGVDAGNISPDFLPYGVAALSGKRLVYANPALEELTGYDSVQLRKGFPRILLDLIPDAAERHEAIDYFRRPEGGPRKPVVCLRTKDGESRYVEFQHARAEGSVDVIGVQDVTELVLARKRAQYAGAEMKKAMAAKIEGFTGHAHDLRSPMASAKMFLDQLLDDGAVPDVLADAARAVSGNLKDRMDGLRAFMDRMKEDFQSSEGLPVEGFSPKDLLAREAGAYQVKAKAKGLALAATIRAQGKDVHLRSCVLLGDAKGFARAVDNLVSNAIKHTPDGGKVVVDTVVHGVGHQTVELVVAVADTGPGIPEDALADIFKKFQQVSGDPVAAEGHGQGLYNVWQFAQAAGGSIVARNRTAEAKDESGNTVLKRVPGAVFVLRLPFNRANVSSGKPVAYPLREHVLVASSDRQRRLGLLSCLAARGYTAEGAECDDALGILLGRDDFRAVAVWGGEDGNEALETVRRVRAVFRERPVIVVAPAFSRMNRSELSALGAHLVTESSGFMGFTGVLVNIFEHGGQPSQSGRHTTRMSTASSTNTDLSPVSDKP